MILGGAACHPELVEGLRVKALPTMLRQAQHDTHFYCVMGRHEAIANYAGRICMSGIASYLAMTIFFCFVNRSLRQYYLAYTVIVIVGYINIFAGINRYTFSLWSVFSPHHFYRLSFHVNQRWLIMWYRKHRPQAKSYIPLLFSQHHLIKTIVISTPPRGPARKRWGEILYAL